MKSLQDHLTEYIAARRALGTQLQEPAHALRQFVEFLSHRKACFITIQLALEWSQQPKGVQRATWARKLSIVRQFARWMSVIDARHQIPPPRLMDVRHRRSKPHIYNDKEIARLMSEASGMKSRKKMKVLNMKTLIGLLAATGLRPGEASALEIGDVDLHAGVLIIRETKFGKYRHVPIHKSTVMALERYVQYRNNIFPNPRSSFFFVSDRGTALCLTLIRKWFAQITSACGLRKRPVGRRYGRGPRLQDFRHTFATRCLIDWYKSGYDVAAQMPKLSTYLGHSSVGCTYWYIESVPELLKLATEFQLKPRQEIRS